MQFPSKLIEDAVTEVSKLPGIGKKTALRLVLHLLKEDPLSTESLADALVNLRTKIKFCKVCKNVSDSDMCSICSSHRRDASLVCVVEDTPDVMAIENTGQYNGRYHVLGGIISPINGIGPDDLNLESLIQRVKDSSEITEVILALSATMEGDTTAFYITKKLSALGTKVSTIARGVPVGGELEFADEITLARSIMTRSVYKIED